MGSFLYVTPPLSCSAYIIHTGGVLIVVLDYRIRYTSQYAYVYLQ